MKKNNAGYSAPDVGIGFAVLIASLVFMVLCFHAFHAKEMKPIVPIAVSYDSVHKTGVVVNVVITNGMSILTATAGTSVNRSKQYPQVSSGIEKSYISAVSADTNLVVGDCILLNLMVWHGQLTIGSPDIRIATKL